MIGIFGGTFNPIHWGHLRTAVELQKTLRINPMILVPSGVPPHREQPGVDAGTRLEMVKNAVEEQNALEHADIQVDDREILRSGPSYTVDTLTSFRDQYPRQPICFIVGADAFLQLHTWYQWKKIFDLAHLIVVHRPGWSLNQVEKSLPDELRSVVLTRSISDYEMLHKQLSGMLLCMNITDIDISSSEIRKKIAAKESERTLEQWLPGSVINIIQAKKLYKT